MAHNYEISREHGKTHVRVKGSFTPSGAAVSAALGATRGTGFTPSWLSTGVYRVTLDENFVRVVSWDCTFQQITADAAQISVNPGSVVEANRTFDIIAWAAGAKADIAASGILRRINFDIIVALTDIPGSGAQA